MKRSSAANAKHLLIISWAYHDISTTIRKHTKNFPQVKLKVYRSDWNLKAEKMFLPNDDLRPLEKRLTLASSTWLWSASVER